MCKINTGNNGNENVKIKIISLIVLMLIVNSAYCEITVTDDSGSELILAKPVTRIISLAPHITELLYAAGAGEQILGTVSYSDYPPAAKNIPVIGSYVKVDYEKVLALQPDVVIYWKSGNPQSMIDGIRKLDLKLFNSEPDDFEDIALSIKALGRLMGTEAVADKRAQQYLRRLEKLRKKYADKNNKKVRVFYQVWNRPLMTINKQHLVNDIIEFCGGVNVFGELDTIAPTVDMESVMQKNPDVIITGMAKGRELWLDEWQKWQTISAVKSNSVYAIDAGLIVRQTPRIVDGTQKMCEMLQDYRDKIGANE